MPGRPVQEFVVDPGPLGARLRRIRTEKGIPLDGIDGVGRSTLEQIERGRGVPSLDTALRLADAFGCTLDHLVGHDLASCEQADGGQPLPGSVDLHGRHRCCGGLGEHFGTCAVGTAIDAARWAIARSQVVSL